LWETNSQREKSEDTTGIRKIGTSKSDCSRGEGGRKLIQGDAHFPFTEQRQFFVGGKKVAKKTWSSERPERKGLTGAEPGCEGEGEV